MSWDEAFSLRYDEWSAEMTEDVAFYVQLAREAVKDVYAAMPLKPMPRRRLVQAEAA